MPSFSSQTKMEAARVPVKNDCCRRAELFALFRFCGVIGISRAGLTLTLDTSLEPVAQRILSLIRKVYNFPCDIRRVEREQLNRQERTQIVLSGDDARCALLDCRMLREGEDGAISFDAGVGFEPQEDCCRDAYFRGVFLACGTMQPPNKGYHLEFVVEGAQLANDLCRMFFDTGWNAHLAQRREKFVVYIKEAECIAQFLAHIGAVSAYLQMEDERMLREIKNDVNRSVNCSTANIKKTTEAALRQIRSIELLEKEGVLRNQPLSIRQTAEMRLEYPEASLDELARMSNVSRSGINHRLRKLVALADSLSSPQAE